jgi:hypothetical protein
MQESADDIAALAAGRTIEEFRTDKLLQRAIKRGFEIVGEALSRPTSNRHSPPLRLVQSEIAFASNVGRPRTLTGTSFTSIAGFRTRRNALCH